MTRLRIAVILLGLNLLVLEGKSLTMSRDGGTMHFIESLERRRLLSVSQLKDINPGANGSAGNWHLEMNGLLFFVADDGAHGSEQFVTDGTADGTRLVLDINPGAIGSAPAWHTRLGNFLYFTADDGTHGRELWRTDGTAAGTTMIADIHPTGTGVPLTNTWLTAMDGNLYFAGTNGTNGVELWKSDGTAAGTSMVADIRTGDASPTDLTVLGEKLLFSALDNTHGRELWVSDGSPGGTSLVKDINTIVSGSNTLSSSPNTFAELNGVLYFRAVDTTSTGVELWRTDGTSAGTYLLKDINPSGSSQPNGYRAWNGNLYFQATTGSSDTELYKTDGTSLGTVLVKDINNGTLPSSPSNFTPLNGELWFAAEGNTGGRELWATDGTAANTRLIKDLRAGGASSPDWFTLFNNSLFFTADDGSTGRELWRSDGTAVGTTRVADINIGSAASTPYLPRILGDAMYFFATTAATGSEYWKLAPPKMTASSYDVNARSAVATFDQEVSMSLLPANYSLIQLGTNTPFAVSGITYDSTSRTARITTVSPLPDGNYRLSLLPGSVADPTGNRLIGSNTIDFFVLIGDINRNRMVDFDDLLTVAQNYGQTGKTFLQGNFDYSADGLVGFDDLLMLAQRYGSSLAIGRSITAAAKRGISRDILS